MPDSKAGARCLPTSTGRSPSSPMMRAHGVELWRSDGTRAGTKLVDDIRPGKKSARPRNLKAVGRRLFFVANEGTAVAVTPRRAVEDQALTAAAWARRPREFQEKYRFGRKAAVSLRMERNGRRGVTPRVSRYPGPTASPTGLPTRVMKRLSMCVPFSLARPIAVTARRLMGQ